MKRMRCSLTCLVLSLLMTFLLLPAVPAYAAGTGQIVILHTNDVHCEVNQKKSADGAEITNLGYAAVAAYKKAMEAAYGADHVALVDAGDHIQGGSIGTVSKGWFPVSIMNSAGYDLAVPGNHEFDYGMERFLALTKKAVFPYLCCNLSRLADGSLLFSPWKMETYGGTRIAYIGIATPESFTKSTPAYFQDGAGNYLYSFAEDLSGQKLYAAVQSAADAAIAAGADYVVAVGHLGEAGITPAWKASAVIANTSGIDILIDGHSHEQLEDRLLNRDGRTVVRAQTGTKLSALGKIVIDPATGNISQELVSGCSEQDAHTLSYIGSVENFYGAKMQQTVGKTAQLLTTKDPATGRLLVRSGETNLGDLCADAYRLVLGADIGIINGGAIRTDLAAGDVTCGDLLNMYPFGNTCCVVKLKGQTLLDALELSARNYPEPNGGFLQVSGLAYSVDPSVASPVVLNEKNEFVSADGARRVYGVTVNGEALDPEKEYTVGGIDYTLLNGGDGYSMFGRNVTVLRDGIMGDYECISAYIQINLHGSIGDSYGNPYGQGRITIAETGH